MGARIAGMEAESPTRMAVKTNLSAGKFSLLSAPQNFDRRGDTSA